MKIRIKFKKDGVMKFIGHLDIMRYFQKLLRRSGIPISYTTGMSPHQIMSFAMPLGIGIESDAEYVDIEISDAVTSENAIAQMNKFTVEGIKILSFKQLPDNAKNAMASICAAKYTVSFKEKYNVSISLIDELRKIMQKDTIEILKQTKKNESIIDIKPGIIEFNGSASELTLVLATGSALNIKPEMVIEAILKSLDMPYVENSLNIKRLEIYTFNLHNKLISLDAIGNNIL